MASIATVVVLLDAGSGLTLFAIKMRRSIWGRILAHPTKFWCHREAKDVIDEILRVCETPCAAARAGSWSTYLLGATRMGLRGSPAAKPAKVSLPVR